jgi:hypothetical protein
MTESQKAIKDYLARGGKINRVPARAHEPALQEAPDPLKPA